MISTRINVTFLLSTLLSINRILYRMFQSMIWANSFLCTIKMDYKQRCYLSQLRDFSVKNWL